MSSRNLEVDTLRGLACIMLVTYHVIGIGDYTGLRLQDGHPLRVFNDLLIYIRMPLFSFLSGFVYAWRPFDGDARRFAVGKVKRLLVPMLLVGTFFAVLQANTPGANHTQYDWRLLHVIPVAHFWFLESLFFVFMAVAAMENLRWLRHEQGFIAVWVLTAALHVINPLPAYFGLWGAAYLLPYFLLGVWCNRFSGRHGDGRVQLIALAILLITTGYVALFGVGLPERNAPTALSIGAGACIFLQRLRLSSKWIAWIGIHSFAIYLFHTMFSAASRIALYKLGEFPVAALLLVGLVAGLLGPIATEQFLKRYLPGLGSWVLGESFRSRRTATSDQPA